MQNLKMKLYDALLNTRNCNEYNDAIVSVTEKLMRLLNENYTTLEDISEDGHYLGEYTSGNCVEVTLERNGVFVTCGEIVLWDDEGEGDGGGILEETYDEWLDIATKQNDGTYLVM